MPAGDRKIAAYLRELAMARALKRALLVAEAGCQSKMRGLTGGELARATKLIEDGQTPDVTVRVKFNKLRAGQIQ